MSNKVLRSTLKAVQKKQGSDEEEDEFVLEHQVQEPSSRHNMPTFGETGNGVPAFLAKLWRLVEDTETNNLICWSKDGRSFIIHNQAQFARELLPLNYKHNNMASFIRQLNMYGFHKITSIENGGLRFDRDEIEFSHPCFKRNYPYLLDHIKRKISNTKSGDEKGLIKQETVSKVLNDVKAMRGRQDNLDSRFSVMKQENESLWREIASLRQKHAKQQQIVNKLIQFLISIVQPSRNMSGVKRHMQLMINDTPENARARTISETESEGGGGPVIHELSEELLDEVMNPHSPFGKHTPTAQYDTESVSPQAIERPRSNISMSSNNYDYSNQSGEDLFNMASATAAGGNLLPNAASPMPATVSLSPAQQSPYTVTEAPDSHVQELPNSPFSEELNVLTTPMVREQEARNRLLLKEKNKQRRRAVDQEIVRNDSFSKSQRRRTHPKTNDMPQPLQVKTEPEATLYMSSETVADPNMPSLMQPSSTDLFSVDFISDDMPADIFEDASLLSNANDATASNTDAAYKLQQQQQFGLSTVNNGKFATNTPLNFDMATMSGAGTSVAGDDAMRNDANLASTSKAAATAANDAQAMAVAKYTRDHGAREDNLHDVVTDHLDNVQDELDTLKDLLRGEGVSIDQNMLLGCIQNAQRAAGVPAASGMSASKPMSLLQLTDEDLLLKLFNDAELLDNYGLSFPNDSLSGDKKINGSELMSYQPSMYDLSDILDNDESNKNQSAVNSSPSGRQLQTQSSVLNTPRHGM